MTAGPNVVTPDTPANQIAELVDRDGYAIIENLACEEASGARKELTQFLETTPYGENEWLGYHTKRFGRVLQRSTAARGLVIHPTVMAVADEILLHHCARYQLNVAGVIHIGPGESEQTLHRDTLLYPFEHPYPAILLPTMWALTDFTEANGATRLVPGSHLWEQDRQPYEDEMFIAEMPAGSVLIYLGGMWHGGGRNRSNTGRMGLTLQYSAGWLRQEENQYLANPPEVAREYPEPLQRLIGYDFGGPFLGFVNGDDPKSVLDHGHELAAPSGMQRSRPDIDEAAARMTRLPLGTLKAVPTPERKGTPLRTQVGFEEVAQS